MRHVVSGLVVVLASMVQLAACSSPQVTTLEKEKTFSKMSEHERHQYCEDRDHYMSSRVTEDDLKKISCADSAGAVRSRAADSPRARAACHEMFNACMSVPAPKPATSCKTFAANASTCLATVSDAEDCATERADALEERASNARNTCDEARGRSQRRARTKEHACTRLDSLCPNLFGERDPYMSVGSAALVD